MRNGALTHRNVFTCRLSFDPVGDSVITCGNLFRRNNFLRENVRIKGHDEAVTCSRFAPSLYRKFGS